MKRFANILTNPKVKLIHAMQKSIIKDTFDNNLDGWIGDTGAAWHKMTIDTNADQSSGLTGGLALNSAGCYAPGSIEKEIELSNYGEVVFEHYVQNPDEKEEINKLNFYIDGVLKMSIEGPSPWQRCQPIGLTPGKHKFKFEYIVKNPSGRKGVFDTFLVTQGKDVDCIVIQNNPAKPVSNLASTKTLRGFTRIQQMCQADTEIEFTALFEPIQFQDFIIHSNEIFYYIDEFGSCYRGSFPSKIDPKSIAMDSLYTINLTMLAAQKAGMGFC
ncbi:hypothetical protein [Anaerophilus nitritogenes]|uniref:hypothetical protein n=1 Tax=Anaerophilus nitritogenes TaxID=2498136 RepID=UPI00101CB863|nr:hypothetical protein [Anaerophilus nitritogenes]